MEDMCIGDPPFREWPKPFNAALCLTWDVDDEAPFYSRGVSPHHDISEIEQRKYGVRRALPLIFNLLQEARIPACFYVPAYIAKQWPKVIKTLADYQYEIGGHGFLHEPVRNLTFQDEADIVNESLTVLRTITRQSIVGYRTPSWQFNTWSPEVLSRYGILYDSSLMGDISVYQFAGGVGKMLLEIPIHWNLDDVEHWGHTHVTRDHSISSPTTVYEIWTDELRGIVKQGGVCVLTLHPHVSGRPGFLYVIQRFIDFAKTIHGLWITTPGQIAQHIADNALRVPLVQLASEFPDR